MPRFFLLCAVLLLNSCQVEPVARGEPAARMHISTAGSLVLRRMDRRGHKSGTGAPLRRGFFEGGRSDNLLSWT